MAGAMTLIEKTIIFLLRFTGLRVSEAVSLRIRDVNLLTCSRTNADGRISGAEEAPSLRDMAAVTQLRA
jgi:integrase